MTSDAAMTKLLGALSLTGCKMRVGRRNKVRTVALDGDGEILAFEKLPVTTITLVIHNYGKINTTAAFYLLPITRVEITEPPSENKSRFKAPHHTPGSILSLRYKGRTRGLICRSSTKHFKHSITADVSVRAKNVNLKVSPSTIQLCGASSVSDGEEAALYVIQDLLMIQAILDRLRSHPEQERILKWAEDSTRGPLCASSQSLVLPEMTFTWPEEDSDHELIPVAKPYPDFVDEDVGDFLLEGLWEFASHSSYKTKLEFLRHCFKEGVIVRDGPYISVVPDPSSEDSEESQELGILDIEEAMTNYNFSLGFSISRSRATVLLQERGFYTRFDNALTEALFCELPYHIPDRKQKKGKVPHISFIVYKTGSVTLSGPGGVLMKKAYLKFMQAIVDLREELELL